MESPRDGGVRPGLLASDRSPAAEAVQLALWRRMSPLEKARVTSELTRSAYLLSLAGVRRRHPSASERECFLRLALVTLGRALACRVYPEAASLVDP